MTHPVEGRQQFLVAGPPTLLRALVDVMIADPEMDLLSMAGPAAAPERLVARMPVARADQLRRGLGAQLLVEPDEQLFPQQAPTSSGGRDEP